MKTRKTSYSIWSLILTVALVCSAAMVLPAAAYGSEEGGAGFADGDLPSGDTGEDGELAPGAGEEGGPGEDAAAPGDTPIAPFAGFVVKTAQQLEWALTNKEPEIDLGANITYRKGIVVDGWGIIINMGGYSLDVTNSSGYGLTVKGGGSVVFNSDGAVSTNANITGVGCGIFADHGDVRLTSDAGGENLTKVNAVVSAKAGIDMYVIDAKNATVEAYSLKDKGVARCVGVHATGSDVTVYGPISLTGKNTSGVLAQDSTVRLPGSSALKFAGVGFFAFQSKVYAEGRSINLTDKKGIGVWAGTASEVYIGDITASGEGSYGITADHQSKVAAGNIKATGKGGIGILANYGSHVEAGNIDADFKGAEVGLPDSFKAGSVRVTGENGVGIEADDCLAGAVTLTGDVLVSGRGSVGLKANRSAINVQGKVTATNARSTGIIASSPGSVGTKITVDRGLFTATGARAFHILLQGEFKQAGEGDVSQGYGAASKVMPGYLEYTDMPNPDNPAANTVRVMNPDYQPVCEIVGGIQYDSFEKAVEVAGNGDTIKMLVNHVHDGGIVFSGKLIWLDLNGKTLDVVNNSGTGLSVSGSGKLRLVNPENGEFNVKGTTIGLYLSGGTGYVEVTDVAATAGVGANCVNVSAGVAQVYGDVRLDASADSSCRGVNVATGARLVVDGSIIVSPAATYVMVDGNAKGKTDYITPTTNAGYFTYSAGSATVCWVRDPDARPVCSIDSTLYYDLLDAIKAVPTGAADPSNARTIRLLGDIDCSEQIVIGNKNITLDLNGYALDVNIPASVTTGAGLSVSGGGGIKLLDPYNGAFNVSCEQVDAVVVTGNSKAEVSSASTKKSFGYGVRAEGAVSPGPGNPAITVYGDVETLSTNGSHAVSADYGGSVTVHGNVASSAGAMNYAAYAARGNSLGASNITINGEITALPGSGYIYAGADKIPGDYDPVSARQGYHQFSGGSPTATVWVRDPSAFLPVSGIFGVPGEIAAGVPYTLEGVVVPASATNKAILWSIKDAGGTGATLAGNVLTAKAKGTLLVEGTIIDGDINASNEMIPYGPQVFTIEVVDPPVSLLSVSPTHAILSNTVDAVSFTAQLAPGHDNPDNYRKIEWSVEDPKDPGGAPVAAISVAGGGRRASVYALSLPSAGKTVQVTAVYDKVHIATATVELLPDLDDLNAKLLETKATVNKAKEVGALVPVLITKQGPDAFGMSAFSIGSPGYTEPEAAGSVVVESVSLVATSSKLNDPVTKEARGYSARMYGYDDRYIAIDADGSAKNATVDVYLRLADGTATPRTIPAGRLTLSLTEKYPKITLKAGPLNLAFPDRAAALTAASPDGACTIKDVSVPFGTVKYDYTKNEFRLDGQKKKGTVKPTVEVAVEGYKKAYKKAPKVSVKVESALPAVKLSPASVKLLRSPEANSSAAVRLVTGNKKVPFESGYKVTDVKACAPDKTYKSSVEVTYSGGVISVKPAPGCVKGKARLEVWFEGGGKPRYLTLKVGSVVNPAKVSTPVKPSSKVKSVTVNTRHGAGAKIADIPVSLGVANHVVDDWKAVNVGSGAFDGSALDDAISVTPAPGQVTLSVKDRDKLEDLLGKSAKKSFTLRFGSTALNAVNGGKLYTFSVKLTVTNGKPAMTVKTKGKVDIANPGSAVTVTVSTTNTIPDIAKVELLTGTGAAAAASQDFRVVSAGGKSFKIAAAHRQLVPGVSKAVYARVTLKNGIVFTSKKITVKPTQTKSKAVQGRKAVTLYKYDPLRGQTVSLGLKTPANVKLGAVQLNQKTLDGFGLYKGVTPPAKPTTRTDGFRLEQSGGGNWTIYFEDPVAPQKKNGAKPGSSYTLQIELWAEGTYTLVDQFGNPTTDEASGRPVALQYYNKSTKKWIKSKPTMVKVKVNIR